MTYTTLIAAAAATMIGSAASASVIVFDFEDANNGAKSYSKDGYTFDPLNFNNGQCFDDGENPNTCFLEVKNGNPTNLTPDEKGTDFDMLGFYLSFQGQGATEDNIQTFTGDYLLGGSFTTEIEVGMSYSGGTGAFDVFLASDGSLYEDEILNQGEYFVLFNDDNFDDLARFTWDASEGAQNRIDCVFISPDGMNITSSALSSCAASSPPPIPLPGGLPLMASGLALAAIVGRRKLTA